MASPPDPAAVGLFAEFVRRTGAGAGDFERFCREHPEHAAALRELKRSWDHLAGVLERLETAGPLAARIQKEYGVEADPGISLAREEEPKSGSSASVLGDLDRRKAGFGRYLLQDEIDRGGQGAILRVWDGDLRRLLAMKVLLGQAQAPPGSKTPVDTRSLGRFLEEAQVTGQLDHPGIVPVHELGLDPEGRIYFTMKLVKGRTMREILELVRDGREGWTRTRALGLLLKVCEAMAYAHAKGVVHRDLKPANVMVGRFGEVFVMDWGLAKVLGRPETKDVRIAPETMTAELRTARRELAEASPDSPLMTMDGDVVGTPAYMAPEQARGESAEIGPHSDVYSMGAILYHLLAGHAPYLKPGVRVSNYAIWYQVQEGPPDPIQRVALDAPLELVAICEKAMARVPAERYLHMGELGADLAAFLEHRVVSAHRVGALPELSKWVERNRALSAALAAGFLAVLLGFVASLFLKLRSDRYALQAAEGERKARENFALAEERSALAARNEAEAVRRRAEVLRLSAFQQLDDLVAEADELWPPGPALLARYDAWLARARALALELDPDPEQGSRGHRAQLAELRARALPEAEADRGAAAHPRAGELERLEARLDALRRAQAVRRGESAVETPALPADVLEEDPLDLNDRAWELIAPERETFGEETRGLALARHALERATGPDDRASIGDTLAWALFACGLDEEALASSEAALLLAPAPRRREMESYLENLEREIEAARSGETLAALEREHELLRAEVNARGVWRFASEEDRWWHDQLAKLVSAIEAFADPETGLIDGISAEHGWGVARRMSLAAELAQRSLSGEDAARRWAEAVASIADAAQCPAYGGLQLEPELGLIPIGRDPDSGLWEFAHLLSGDPAERGADGRLVLEESTGIVLVLIPGGTFWMGAQRSAPGSPNYDPEAESDEGPVHEVTLSPFFLSKYELTQAQWSRATGDDPSYYGLDHWNDDWTASRRVPDGLLPVEQVSWFDCRTVLARLGLQLPSEAQWEYAARAGTSSAWWTGADPSALARAGNVADAWARANGAGAGWKCEPWDDGHTTTAAIGSLAANAFGLHDVHGNVWEWCADAFQERYPGQHETDPRRELRNETRRVQRGGCFYDPAAYARSASRGNPTAEHGNNSLGVRPARALSNGSTAQPSGSR